MTEPTKPTREIDARDELEDTIIKWQSGVNNNAAIGEAIDALLVARTEAIIQYAQRYAVNCAKWPSDARFLHQFADACRDQFLPQSQAREAGDDS